ncbi:hypothetical protein SAMN05421788_104443 [Filimonas lacunae]|uniref:Uncharacterized protein n=1 Tax=Filimonas lacunae TaxID=477680 RepID=A0A173MRR4_9BACT|nr:hypothetical protein [Filimonas lacunae]BAV10187.1 hypothetical protein FLA_6247 [Filimonas lacunae]SIT18474.1 hypothetical protein SAMN05421788_104443 [Filimonas lacunae]
MAASTSIAQEFYKVRNEWAKADKIHSWKLAIWLAEFSDVDIMDKFMETERLPIGIFDDIFFRFDTEYKGDKPAFEQALWEEYKEWFIKPADERYDMYQALKNDGVLLRDYTPDTTLTPTFQNLMKELVRFRSCLDGMDKNTHFCLYFPPGRPDTAALSGWFTQVLKQGVPNEIRLATIDFAQKRKVVITSSEVLPLVMMLNPVLDMPAAIDNEMSKGGGSYDTVSIDAQYRNQIRVVMNATLKKEEALLNKEVDRLLTLSRQMKTSSTATATLLVAAQAYFTIGSNALCNMYAEDAIKQSAVLMEQGDVSGYPTWKACMMLKGALLMGKRNRKASLEIYEELALVATGQGDAFFIMEGYRLCGHLWYEMRMYQKSFEVLLLSITAGSYLELEVRRQSTFLQAAYLALFVGKKIKTEQELQPVKEQLESWLGEDWAKLLQQEGVVKAKTKPKRKLFA